MKEITAEGVNRNLQPNTEKLSSRQSRRREAREQRRRAHWTKIDRKTGSPSLIPEGEEANCVCRENGTQSGMEGKKTRGSKGVTKNSRGVILDKHSVWCANIPNTNVIKI